MKHVHPNGMVAHLWANQSQPEARSHNGQFYFRAETIYSYGSHFPIARFVRNPEGERAVLFTNRHYSPTTSHHCSMARRALAHGIPVHTVSNPDAGPQDCLRDTLSQYQETLKRARAARITGNRPYLLEQAKALSQQYLDLGRFYSIQAEPLWSDAWEGQLAQIKQAEALALAERNRRAQIAAEERERALAERMADWLAGARVSPPHTSECRLRVIGTDLETSWGAVVPLADAVRVFRVAACCRAAHRACSDFRQCHGDDAARVGDFRVDHIDENGTIRAGCHLIAWAEAERVAASIGLGVQS